MVLIRLFVMYICVYRDALESGMGEEAGQFYEPLVSEVCGVEDLQSGSV